MGKVLIRAFSRVILLDALGLKVATTSLVDVRQVHLLSMWLRRSVHQRWLLIRVRPWDVVNLLFMLPRLEELLLLLNLLHLLDLLHLLKHKRLMLLLKQ